MVANLLPHLCQLTSDHHTLVSNSLSTSMMMAVEHGYADVLHQVISVLRPLIQGTDFRRLELHEHDWTVLKLLTSRSATEGRPTLDCLSHLEPEPV